MTAAVLLGWIYLKRGGTVFPLNSFPKKERLLDKYTYDALSKRDFTPSQISIGKTIKNDPTFTSSLFYYLVDGKKVSGVINAPKKPGSYPAIVMFRGYVDKDKYTPGTGTEHAGEIFARNGLITLAPDFLGYGESDLASNDSIEDRFQTYTTGVILLTSLKNLNEVLPPGISADITKVGVWGHSNGGQIAISVLEISGRNYPTVLWAPVSKPFPYSVLYYTDEFEDHGRALRAAIANFEKDYDSELYSPTNYLARINATIQLNQGTDDEEVPLKWSSQFYDDLKKLNKDVTYFTYTGQDHNFDNPQLWLLAVNRGLAFYKQNFMQK